MHTGAMIAFYPSPEMALALHTALGGYTDLVAPTEMHLTLAYLGEIAELEAQGISQEKVLGVLNDLVGVLKPVEGVISGTGRFMNTHLEDKDAIVLLVDSPQLPDTRAVLTNELTAQGIPYAQNHGFTPHITVMYLNKGDAAHYLPPVSAIVFNSVTLAWGEQRTDVSLTKPDTVTMDTEEDAPAQEVVTIAAESDSDEPGVIEKALRLLRRSPKEQGAVVGFKALGNGKWMTTFTNNFEDKQKQILSEKAHDRYIARLDAGLVPMPVLRHWHIVGSEHGVAEWIGRAGHMVIAIGRFDDTPQGRAAEKAYQSNPDKYGVSHKYYYPLWAEKAGVIDEYNAFEISTAPRGAEVNPYTGISTIQEDIPMPLDEMKKKSLRKIFKDEEAYQSAMKAIEASEAQGDKIAQLAVNFKAFADVTPAEVAPEPGIPADLLLVVLEGQKSLSDGFDVITQALEGMKTQFEAKVAQLETAQKAYLDKASELQLRLDEKPRRIEDAETVTDEKAADAIAKMSAGVEFDPRYPGMQVPLANGK